MNPQLVVDQLDDRMQQPVGGRRDAFHFATPYDQPVQMIDLSALAARLMSDLILGEVLLSARHLVEIATLLFLQTPKREKFYPGRQLIGGLFSPHSSLIADRSCQRSGSYSPAIVHWMTIIILNLATA